MGNALSNRHRRLSFNTALMSHRGGSLERVENTLAAFRHSAALNTDLILEMDVCMTKDGECVVFHDNDLGRLCGMPGKRIEDLRYAELPELLIPEPLKDKERELRTEKDATRIPRFEEVLKEFPEFPMQVDVKRGSEEMVIKVGTLIHSYNRASSTVWGTFNPTVNNLCYKHFQTSIPLFFDYKRAAMSYFLSYFGLSGYMKYRESALIMPDDWYLMRPSWFKALNREGISVIVWGKGRDGGGPGGGINTIEKFNIVRKSGANGICTDRPSLLKEWLEKNPLNVV